ncbi:MAG: hypothetical protein GY920_17375 [Aliivibrio sp.]|jgi:hypothetical protein|nr:hypothetical protein [Aliivibrio sp.]
MTYEYTGFGSEVQLFNFLKKYLIPDLEKTKTYSRTDCYSERYKLNIELKVRKRHYNELMLEKKKYDAVIRESNKKDMLPVYINATPHGIWAFYLLKTEYDWIEKELPKTTYWNNNERVTKVVTFLNINQGIDLLPLVSLGKL